MPNLLLSSYHLRYQAVKHWEEASPLSGGVLPIRRALLMSEQSPRLKVDAKLLRKASRALRPTGAAVCPLQSVRGALLARPWPAARPALARFGVRGFLCEEQAALAAPAAQRGSWWRVLEEAGCPAVPVRVHLAALLVPATCSWLRFLLRYVSGWALRVVERSVRVGSPSRRSSKGALNTLLPFAVC